MYTRDDVHINDAWYYAENGIVHCFYLVCPRGSGGFWDIGHLVSEDLYNWQDDGLALERGDPGAWDDERLATGSVLKYGGRYWMAYTGHHEGDELLVQRVGMAFSDDLHRWDKIPENPVTEADPEHYEIISTGKRAKVNWRDPFLLETADGVLQLVCARRRDGDVSSRGTVGVAKSTDMRRWQILPPLQHDRIAEELEVPQIYGIGNRFYLVFCTLGGDAGLPDLISPNFKAGNPEHSFRNAGYSMVASSPLGPFHIHGTGEILDNPPAPWFYASQLVEFRGRWYLLATMCDEETEQISDPIPVEADETGLRARIGGHA